MAYVYLHKRLDKDEIFYVGIGKNVERAYSKHSRNKYWKNIVAKTEYEVEIIAEDLSWEDACKMEIELICKYGRNDFNQGSLCNLTNGGDGVNEHSIDSINKIRAAHIGRKQSQDEIQRRVNALKGKTRSESTKLKMSQVRKGIKFSDEHLKNLSLAHLGQTSANSKIAFDALTGIYFDSLRSACNSLNKNYKAEFAKVKRNTNERFIFI